MEKKTKSVGGKEYPASAFAYVGDPQDPSTWHLLVADKAHVEDALARFNQTGLPASAKATIARKLVRLAKKFGIDASGFAKKYAHASEADMSFGELVYAIQDALKEKFGTDAYGSSLYVACEPYPDYVIARGPSESLYRIPYTLGDNDGDGDNDDVILGDPQEVEVAYAPVSESAAFVQEASGDDGTFRVQVLESGFARGHVLIDGVSAQLPHYYTPEVVAQVAEAVNGARFGRRHPDPRSGGETVDADRIAGWLDEGQVSGNAALATVHVFESERDLRAKLNSARSAGKLNLFGVSILGLFGYKLGTVEGKKAIVMEKLAKLTSVDLCAEPGAGGKFLNPLRVAASADSMAEIAELQRRAVKPQLSTGSSDASRKEGAQMKDKILKVLEALRKRNAARADELTLKFNGLKEEEYSGFLAEVSEAAIAATETAAAATTAATTAPVNGEALVREAQNVLAEARKLDTKNRIEAKLITSKLPQPAVALVREHLKDQLPDDAGIDAEIARVREAFAAFSTTGRASARGIVVAGLDSQDKIVLAMEAMVGIKTSIAKCRESGIAPLRSLKEGYVLVTGDRDFAFGRGGRGGFAATSEAVSTGSFPNILLDALNKKLVQDYSEYAIKGFDMLYIKENLADFKTQHRIRMGYFSDLSDVAEAGPYTEIAPPTDEQITYSASKKGNLLTVSEETIRNDDLGKIAAFPQRLARAARHTFYKRVTNFFTNNPNYVPDGLAWFHANHSNLGSNPLSIAELAAREVALGTQTEKDSGNPLGFPLRWLMVPLHLKSAAYGINNTDKYNTGPGLSVANEFYQRFGAPDADGDAPRIIVNTLLDGVDQNDWYYGTDPAQGPFLVVGFLDGIEEPQLFFADLPTQGTLFTNDQIQYKVKHVYGIAIEDFRTVGKNVVP